jgi:hypothetical protein
MILLGLLLVLLAGGAIVLVATEESSRYILFGYTIQLDWLGMFLVGAATAAVLLVGIAMISSGSRRSAHRRREVRAARAEASSKVAQLEDEKRELERKLQREPEPTDRLVAGPTPESR